MSLIVVSKYYTSKFCLFRIALCAARNSDI